MSDQAEIYAQGHKGLKFTGQLLNIDDADDPMPQSLINEMIVYVIFKKPDGTISVQLGELEDENADLSDGADIVYHDDDADEPSLLDQRGYWEYTIAVYFSNGTYIESPYLEGFWVT